MSKAIEEKIEQYLKNTGVTTSGDVTLSRPYPNDASKTAEWSLKKLIAGFIRQHPLLQVTEDVKAFCAVAGQKMPEYPEVFDDETRVLRQSLIIEEVAELSEASDNNNEIEERDALGDIIYVTVGYALQRGTASALDSDWNAIQESNMSKFATARETAKETEVRQKRVNVNCETKELANGYWGVFSLEKENKGKLIKSHLYKPVKLEPIVKQNG